MSFKSSSRRALLRMRVVEERARAQVLRARFDGVVVHRRARLARGASVDVYPGGRLTIGATMIAKGAHIEVGPQGHVQLRCDYVGPHTVIVGRQSVIIESGTLVAEMCVIRDSDHVRDGDGSIHPTSHVSADVYIGQDCWLAARCIVLKGVKVGDKATVGAGSVVTRDVARGATVAGSPARALRKSTSPHGRPVLKPEQS